MSVVVKCTMVQFPMKLRWVWKLRWGCLGSGMDIWTGRNEGSMVDVFCEVRIGLGQCGLSFLRRKVGSLGDYALEGEQTRTLTGRRKWL